MSSPLIWQTEHGCYTDLLGSPMSRFLFTCWSFPGHVFSPWRSPTCCASAGHECAFYSGPRAARMVEGEDFPFYPSDKAEEDAMYDFMFAPEQTRTVNWRTMLEFSTTIQRWLLGSIPQQVEDIERIERRVETRRDRRPIKICGRPCWCCGKGQNSGGSAGIFFLHGSRPGCAAFRHGSARSPELVYPAAFESGLDGHRSVPRRLPSAPPTRFASRYGLPASADIGFGIYRYYAFIHGAGDCRVRLRAKRPTTFGTLRGRVSLGQTAARKVLGLAGTVTQR